MRTPLSTPAGVRPASYLPELEALRGVAITLVFFHHAFGLVYGQTVLSQGLHLPLPMAFLAGGHTGVSLFFVLSAFLLALPFLVELDGGRPVRRRDFYRRRALRILPLYWTVVLCVALSKSEGPVDMLRAIPFLAFFRGFTINEFSPQSGVWWSLETEVQFYLVLPLLAQLRSTRSRWIAGACAVAYALAYMGFLRERSSELLTLESRAIVSHTLFGLAPVFAWGVVAAWVYHRRGSQLRTWAQTSRFVRVGGGDFVLVAILFFLALLLQWVLMAGAGGVELGPWQCWHVLEGFLWAAALLTILVVPLRTKSWICNPAFERIRVLSYSVYLLHLPVLMFAFGWARGEYLISSRGWDEATIGLVPVLFAACLAIASLTYLLIERPFLVRKARI